MLPNMEQYGQPGMELMGITIHNTGNDMSAKRNFRLMSKRLSDKGCHYLIDENEIIQCLPLDYRAYHTGKGDDWGNNHTIAIEICRSTSDLETYMAAQERAVDFIKELMMECELSTEDIYFHNDFNHQTYCPHRILQLYGNKNNFIKGVF